MTNQTTLAGIPARLQAIEAATGRLLATVASMPDASFGQPTVLPDWSRAHVVAHLALNAEGMTGALSGLARGEPVPIYVSTERRDADIGELAALDPSTIRDRLQAGVVAFADAVRRVPGAGWSATVDRLPGGPTLAAPETLAMRHREVEIHHADLGAGYGHADWPEPFVRELLDAVTVDQATAGPFTVTASDLGSSWPVGAGNGPEVTGPGGAIGWWLVGRGTDGVTSVSGRLPELLPWRRSPRRT